VNRCNAVCFCLLLVAACSDGADQNTSPTGVAGMTGGGAAESSAGQTGAGTAGTSATSVAAGSSGTGGRPSPAAGSGGQAMAAAGQGGSAAAGSGASGAPAAGAGGALGMSATAGAGGAAGMAAPANGVCDRACLLAVMQGYLDALVAHDPSKLKVSTSLRYTENGVESKLGETLWKTATMLVPDERLDFADPMLGNVASQLVINEGTAPVIYQVRLKVANGEITEIEAMAVRRQGAANGFFNPAKMKPEAVFLQPIDPAKRMTRDAMLALTETYLDYLEGKKRGNQVMFDAMCKRYENGQVTASGLSSFNTQAWSFQLTRRTLIVDEEAGITWGMYPFTQSATSLVVGEAFKLIEGKIMMIQAVMANQPAKVWDMK
jgi:hypothetical protein